MQRHTPKSVLITGPVLAAIIGLAYVFGDPIRTSTPSFEAARSLASIPAWGLLFLAGALIMGVAFVTHNQRLGAVAYYFGGLIYAWWGACFLMQALTDPRASLVGWALYWALAGHHFIVGARCWVNR